MKRAVFTLFFILLFCIIGGIYFRSHPDLVALLGKLTAPTVISIAFVMAVLYAVMGLTFTITLRTLGTSIPLIEATGITTLATFINYFLPGRPGIALKALYFKHTIQFPFSRFSSVLAAQAAITFMVCGVVGIASVLMIARNGFPINWMLVGVCLSLTLASIIPFFLPSPPRWIHARLSRFISNVREGLTEIRGQRTGLALISCTVILQLALVAVVIHLTYNGLGIIVSMPDAMVIGVFTMISNSFSITPNNLGIRELIIAYLVTVIGKDFAAGMLGAGVILVVQFIVTLIMAAVLAPYLAKRMHRSVQSLITPETY